MSFLRDVRDLSFPYWRSPEKKAAWALLIVIVGLNLGEVYINVLLNKWNNDFYNSLQTVNKPAFFAALGKFSYLAASYIAVVVYKIYINQMLQIRWRRWLTADLLDKWTDRQNYYRMQLAGRTSDNPDQRISEDVGQFIDLTLGLTLGLLSSVVTLFSFLFILWKLSGDLTLSMGVLGDLTIPGYMVWAAMVYAVAGTWITSKLGRPLIGLNFDQQRFEADFRFALVRFRENAERVALYKGEAQEKKTFGTRFGRVFDNYWQIMKRQKTLTWFTSGYYQIAIIFPFVVAAPRFFAKQIQLGGLMQTSSAFGQVQGSFSYVISAYTSIATWKAVVARLGGFTAHIAEAARPRSFTPVVSGPALKAEKLDILLPDGKPLLQNLNLDIKKGDAVLINGPSGLGKSTLLRTLAGIWPFAQGGLKMPADSTTLFLPQTPYLPLGPLRSVLYYPVPAPEDDAALREVLDLCRLGHLSGRLDDTENWSHMLSPGEQQRVAFARAILTQPDFIFLDEATSALDETLEAELYALLRKKLPRAAIVSVGHRGTLKAWHDKAVDLKGCAA